MSDITKDNKKMKQHDEEEVSEALQSFESRWKYAVFPAMVAFVILAGFGFYLIYGMLQRMEDLSKDISEMSEVMKDSLPVMQGGVVGMSSRMQWIGEDLHGMRTDVNQLSTVIQETMPQMEGKVGAMSQNISNMTHATSSMANTTHSMGQNLWNMNRNISKPLSIMRKMMPFGGDKTPPPPRMAPMQVYTPNPYYPYSNQAYAVAPQQHAQVAPVQANPVQQTQVASTEPASDANATTNQGRQKFVNLCASCHGTHAEGGVGPSLQTHTAEQIETIFQEYRTGKRVGTMTGIVRTFTEEDIRNIAAFLATYKSAEVKPATTAVATETTVN